MPMANDHPFQQLFENLGRLPTFHADSVNRHAYDVLSETLSVPIDQPGRCVLLRAPRAGHGKTHLLSRIQRRLASTHEFIPLHAVYGSGIDAGSTLNDVMRCLSRPLPGSTGLCAMDLLARRLFSIGLQPLVKSGEVPCQDREGALTALQTRPVETFDFHHSAAVTARWTRDNFEVLGHRLSLELGTLSGEPVTAVGFWVNLLFRFSSAPMESAVRMKALAEAAPDGSGAELEHLQALLGLMALTKRVVLVADDLELFSTDENASLRLAAFLGSLRQSVDRLDVVLSLNLDIWESAFLPRLSGGMADRFSEVVVELEPLREDEMAALLDSRVPGLGSRVLKRIDRSESGSHARGLLRAAGMEWLKATAMDSARRAAEPTAVPETPVERPLPTSPPPPPAEAPAPALALEPARVARNESIPQPRPKTQSIGGNFAPVGAPSQRSTFASQSPRQAPSEPARPQVETAKPAEIRDEPTVAPARKPAAEPPQETNRVDELLRQFRNRYGRGSL